MITRTQLNHFKSDIARKVAVGEEWLVPWFLYLEAVERDMDSGTADLERIKGIGRAAGRAA